MTKEIFKEYAEKLKRVKDDKKFIVGQMVTTYGDDEARYMIDYIDSHPGCTMLDVILANIDYTNEKQRKDFVSAIMGLVVGDALGVPVEFKSRAELKENPVAGMIGYGTHNQPAGTWSDDTSMTLATMDWLSESDEFIPDFKILMDKFSNWLLHGDYTPYGENFDCGIATSKAIMNYGRGMEPLQCGGKSEYDNGNGSLMRILPAALSFSGSLAFEIHDEDNRWIQPIFNLCALTHGHARSKLGCLIYSKIIADMRHMPDEDKFDIIEKSFEYIRKYLSECKDREISSESDKYARLWNLTEFKELSENEIKSSGYVVDTLEAAIWCFLKTDSYKECVLKAVNLGDDTDTVAAVAGGLAGFYYGIEDIPKEWLSIIPKKEWIIELVEKMLACP